MGLYLILHYTVSVLLVWMTWLNDVKETRGYWKLKYGALDFILWLTGFGRGCRTIVRLLISFITPNNYTRVGILILATPR